jgi:hypothetical protein
MGYVQLLAGRWLHVLAGITKFFCSAPGRALAAGSVQSAKANCAQAAWDAMVVAHATMA